MILILAELKYIKFFDLLMIMIIVIVFIKVILFICLKIRGPPFLGYELAGLW